MVHLWMFYLSLHLLKLVIFYSYLIEKNPRVYRINKLGLRNQEFGYQLPTKIYGKLCNFYSANTPRFIFSIYSANTAVGI